MQWTDKLSEDCGRKSKAPDQNGRALFVMYFPLSDMVFVDCGVLVVFDQIYRVHVLVKDAGMNKFLDIAVEDKFTQVPQEELSFLGTGISIGFCRCL